jgi:hypothetical protein
MPLYVPSTDLPAVQNILKADATILSLMNLTDKSEAEIMKKIIGRSQWTDLADNNRRLCVYPVPFRRTPNMSFFEGIFEVDCHVPATLDYIAWQIQEKVFALIHDQKINNKYFYAEPPLGELPTMQGFFCCGTRFRFYHTI